MPRKNPPTGTDADLNLSTLTEIFINEDSARRFIESKVWPNGPVCPHCGCTTVYELTPKGGTKTHVRKGVYKCKECRKQFTVRIGTIFEDSHIPFSKWLMTLHLMTSSKKGISSLQISRELGITVKSAWFMTHRIREAMRQTGPFNPFGGTVEVDETYVGGRHRGGNLRGRSREKKTPVMVLVERDGNARSFPIENVKAKTLKDEIDVNVAKAAIVVTDEHPGYRNVRDDGTHRTIKHSSGEYLRLDADGLKVHTNTAESFFALLKRGHYGIFHQLSRKHLHRYCDEFTFRWDHRKQSDGARMTAAIEGVQGKRLMYKRAGA
jgi:transposase-like protein